MYPTVLVVVVVVMVVVVIFCCCCCLVCFLRISFIAYIDTLVFIVTLLHSVNVISFAISFLYYRNIPVSSLFN